MKITKIKLFNVPFRYSSQDRIIENVDEKIQRWAKTDFAPDAEGYFEKVSYSLTNAFEGTITINSPIKYNYARIESDLYNGAPIYVFLISVATIESSEGFTYNVKLDVMASFGKTLFNSMNGKNVLIERMHEDRYVVNGTSVERNIKNHAILNSDFKLSDTSGQKIMYGGVGTQIRTASLGQYAYDTNKNAQALNISVYYPEDTGSKTVEMNINNTIIIDDKIYYAYAILASAGSPGYDPKLHVEELFERTIKSDVWIAPVDIYNEQAHYQLNRLTTLESLQEGKVLSIIYSPFQIIADSNDSFWRGRMWALKKDGATWDILNKSSILNTNDYIRALVVMPLGDALAINTGFDEVALKNFIDSIHAKTITITDLNKIRNGDYTTGVKHEIALLNNEITPIVIDYNNIQVTLDIFNYYTYPYLNPGVINPFNRNIVFSMTEEGINARVTLSQMQSFDIQESNMLSFYSKSGSTYLAQNASYLNAQKAGIDLQGKMQKLQSKTNQAGVYGGGLVGGLMSALNPASWVQSGYMGKMPGVIDKITENEKAKIDAHIMDMNMSAPHFHQGSDKSFAWMNTGMMKHKFNFLAKIPNDIVLRKIYYYIQKHGYKYEDWVQFNADIYSSRELYNYLKIVSVKDFMPQTEYDDSIIMEFEARLENGVRIWHKDNFVIDYTLGNVEKKLLQHFNIS